MRTASRAVLAAHAQEGVGHIPEYPQKYNIDYYFTRYIQTAVASFGPKRQTECGQKPGGFTRITPEVLDWIETKIWGK